MPWRWRPVRRPARLQRDLLAWTLGPIALFMALDAASLYRSTLSTASAAHDRLLRATTQQIGDLLRIERDVVAVSVPLAMIEALEGAGGSRMYYRVLGFDGGHVAGDAALPLPPPRADARELTATYETRIDGTPVQVAALYQAVETSQGQGIVTVLAGETLEARQVSARALLFDMLLRQVMLMAVIAAVVWVVVRRALMPLAALRSELEQRPVDDAAPLATRGPEELQPVIDEMSSLFRRQHELQLQQQRLIADASHQLRTPMTVLKTQLQSALNGDAPPQVVMGEMLRTVDRTTHLANQLLSKVRLGQARPPDSPQPVALREVAQEAVIEMSPLIAARHIDCELDAVVDLTVRGTPWMAGELVRNLLSNAIRHTPEGGTLGIRLRLTPRFKELVVWDSGPGITDETRQWLFEPFAAAHGTSGAGLGLSICLDIAHGMGASIVLDNRRADDGAVLGLDARVCWPVEPA
jgi:two-component system sensor histidine kinase TctE